METQEILKTADVLLKLDPVGTYAQRGAGCIMRWVGADAYRLLEDGDHHVVSRGDVDGVEPAHRLDLGRHSSKWTLELFWSDPSKVSVDSDDEVLAALSRVFGRGLSVADRLGVAGLRIRGEGVEAMLGRTPVTEREREVILLLVSGARTNEIAERTGLSVSTVNTYIKRICAKLGVRSRVALVARFLGTDSQRPQPASFLISAAPPPPARL